MSGQLLPLCLPFPASKPPPLPDITDWDILFSLFYNMSFLNTVLIYLLPVSPSFLVMHVIAIRVINFHFPHTPLLPLDHFRLFSPMYGLH